MPTNKFKRVVGVLLCATILVIASGITAGAVGTKDNTYIQVTGFDESVDYSRLMKQCATEGGTHALQMGSIYEEQRNLKIDAMDMEYEKTSYFEDYNNGSDILAAMDNRANNNSKTDRLKKEHEVAGAVYEYLNQKGFSDTVIAGILGNMMAECGGQTLDLQWDIYGGGGSYYGLCQWSLYYNPDVRDCDITGQLDYLMSNLEKNMNYFGGSYIYFCSIEDAGIAAKYFDDYYERGAGGGVRANNAYAAFTWITG